MAWVESSSAQSLTWVEFSRSTCCGIPSGTAFDRMPFMWYTIIVGRSKFWNR
jgi:hypothetical protein